MENYFTQVCEKCKIDFISHTYNDGKTLDADDIHCEKCGNPYTLTFFNELTDTDVIIEIAGMVLEDRNHHRMTGLPRDLWDNIKEELVLFSDGKKAAIARKLALTFDNIS